MKISNKNCLIVTRRAGYHITYASRVPSIMQKGLLIKLPRKLQTGSLTKEPGIYFVTTPTLAKWAAQDRSLNRKRDWVIIKAQLNPRYIIADLDKGLTPEESIKYGGTFAYNVDISPKHLSIFAYARGTNNEYHDEFESLLTWKSKT